MQESYRKGLASHPGPESCAGGRKATGEALTGAHLGQPSSCEINPTGVPTPLSEAEGHTVCDIMGKSSADPAQSKTLSMGGNSSHGNRETPVIPLPVGGKGRPEKVTSRTSGMHVVGESDDPIVPRKRANKVGPKATAESVEGRGSSKGTVLPVDHVPDPAPDQAGRLTGGPRPAAYGCGCVRPKLRAV